LVRTLEGLVVLAQIPVMVLLVQPELLVLMCTVSLVQPVQPVVWLEEILAVRAARLVLR
jgi:hypothetical protein